MKSWQLLGYLGLLPFIACLYLSIESVNWCTTGKQAFIAYSAIIVSFIAGSVWRKDIKQQIISNIFSLIAFITLLIEPKMALIILAFSFSFLFIYEKKLTKFKTEDNRSNEYMRMRFWLTSIVVLFHIIAYILWGY
jgi:uncharacterized membrane protein HdeD (DUF308 family)